MTINYDYTVGSEIYIVESNDDIYYANPEPQIVSGVHIDISGYATRITYRINRSVLYEYIPSERVCSTYEECVERCKLLNK